jgi:hypothetical protein
LGEVTLTVTTSAIQQVGGTEQKESLPSTLALKQKVPCRHPRKLLSTDPETGEIVCKCGLVVGGLKQIETVEKYDGHSPANQAVFKDNMGEKAGKNGQPPSHYVAVSAVYGSEKYSARPLEFLVKSCPSCHIQQSVRVFGEDVHCQKCGIPLGHYVLRWLPFISENGNGTKEEQDETQRAMRYMADLKMLNLWDPPENDQTLRIAKELFSKKVQGHVSAEKAHFLSRRFLRGVKQLNKVYRKDMENLLEGLLQSEGIKVK